MSTAGGGARRGWASSDDYTFLSLIVIAIGCGFLGWMVWTHYHDELVEAVAWLQISKMTFIGRFTDAYEPLRQGVIHGNYATVGFERLVGMCGQVNAFFRWPAAGLIGALAVLCFVGAPPGRFRRRFDLDSLLREQARFYRAASAMLGRHLKLVDPAPKAPRPADPALHVQEWAGRFCLDTKGGVDGTRLRQALLLQLGPVWRGPRRASPAGRVIFAAFALHLGGRREECQLLLGDLAEALGQTRDPSPTGPAESLPVPPAVLLRADAVLAEGAAHEAAEAEAARHAYETTALMGLLNAARLESGILAPAQFNGLKLLDRSLWYALHSLGFPGHGPGQNSQPNPRVEAVGARSHWQAERQARCPLFPPQLDEAERAVRIALRQHAEEQTARTQP